MNIIYLDTLFFVNFICDYILLVCTARVCGTVIGRFPILTASLLGGVYACLCSLPNGTWLSHPICQIAFSTTLCIISFGREQKLHHCVIVFLLISAIAGGALSAISMTYNGIVYLPIRLKTVLLVFAVLYCLLAQHFRNFPQLQAREYCEITVTLFGDSICFRGLRDSGNELYDPITNRPVIVCSAEIVKPLFPVEIDRTSDPYDLMLQLNQTEEFRSRLCMIPCHTVTGSGMLLGFRPDEVYIGNKPAPHIIAISATKFSANATYQAIY